ncbi:MobF family relaxase [Nonomuraea wenchangensis]|uniref:MobF family relaxase n=2 Tax=Nonomuraea wenchangensis TaxID=568860 RepID=UPI00332E5D90
MAWVSVIGPLMEQVDYRLQEGAGCGIRHADEDHQPGIDHQAGHPVDAQTAYRLNDGRGLLWIGQGLQELGLTPETALLPAQHDLARALMSGEHPVTGEVLVPAKHVRDPRAKLPAAPLGEALHDAASGRGVTVAQLFADRPALAKRAARMLRGIAREGEAHLIPVADLERLAAAAGLDPDQLYSPRALAHARKWRDARVRIGNRGYDLTLDVAKSVSVLYGLADPDFAAELEDVFAAAVTEAVAAMETWAAYGLRGHQGDGQLAERADSTGLLGWVMWHRTARPVGAAAPDPHLHAHVTIANMVRGRDDGKWSTVGAGGRDLHRHAHAADALLKARLRRTLTQRYGISFVRDAHTGAWEIAAIPESVRTLFSKRDGQVKALLSKLGTSYDQASRQARKVAAAESRQRQPDRDPLDLRADWRRQCGQTDIDAAQLVEACRHGPAVLPPRPSAAAIAAWIWRPEAGLTAHRKVVTRADVLAAVIDALPDGVRDLAEAEALTGQVLACAPTVRLPDAGAMHLSNADRYTSADILAAEQAILASVRRRYDIGCAVVDDDTIRLAIDAFQVSAGLELAAEQRAALQRVLGGGHGVEAVIGVAGAGKTTLMAAARAAFEARGLVVRGAATAAVAAANLRAESGIASATIATWLQRVTDAARPGLSGVDVLVVDEAAMVDDRELAALLGEAERTGTKVVLIGDPLQLRAVGVGGAFRATHRQIAGLTLRENRRQRDPVERRAVELWRAERRHEALRTWGEGGRVHPGIGAADTMARLIADWAAAREPYRTGTDEAVHDELAGVLVLAGTNAAVDRLNLAARAVRRELGEIIGPDRTYRIAGGRTIDLAVGDHVRVRKNDYRARRGEADLDVLNGYRGQVTAIDADGRVQVEWRHSGPDGATLARQWISPFYIAGGGLSYGTAMTVAAAQGLTAEHALIYGMGLDPHTLYSAMTRDRETARLYLPRELLETDADRVRHGRVRGPADELQRVLAAYAATLEGERADIFLTPEPAPIAPSPAEPGELPAREVRHAERDAERDLDHSFDHAPQRGHDQDRAEPLPTADLPRTVDSPGRDPERQARAALRRAGALLALSRSLYGVGLLSEAELAARARELAELLTATDTQASTAQQDHNRYVREGGGRAERELIAQRERLAEQARLVQQAATAAEQVRQAHRHLAEMRRQEQDLHRRRQAITGELDTLRPWQRARRRDLEAELAHVNDQQADQDERLRQAEHHSANLAQRADGVTAQAPPQVTWPLVRRRHSDLERDFEAAQRAARDRDVTDAAQRAEQARSEHANLRREFAAVQEEQERRADLPPDRRDIEHAARAEHAQRQAAAPEPTRQGHRRGASAERSTLSRQPTQREREPADRGHHPGP